MDELPVAQGLIVCDRVDVDRRTRNVTLVNRFNVYRPASLPSPPRVFAVYAALTDGYGDIPLTLLIQHLPTDAEVYRVHRTVRFTDRLHEIQYVVRIPGLVFPAGGAYQVSLFAADEPLARQVVRATPSRPPGG
jgi:hypothetical protein